MVLRKSLVEKHIHEAHPNLPGELQAAENAQQPGHGRVTSESVPQNPSTVENRLNPSASLEDPTDDSMFNLADPQARKASQSKRNKTLKRHRVA
jgi:hypothetical protein